ncbi:MAG: 2Fe-2S iron-sulfur cluster binding domain-containing protein [Weeksellaceae bacterium]|nr:2Fe-2S iron-sulfur cluster binding domain-containing protein [Weeksellaceae bacterium]
MFTIQLTNNKSFSCTVDDTILFSAHKEDIALNYSCNSGRCQSCKAKVISGDSVPVAEELGLTEEDKAAGYILCCVRKPISNLQLAIEDLSDYHLEKVRTVPAKINYLAKKSDHVMELHLRTPPNMSFRYRSGQYLNMIKGDFRRSYSIANSNSSPDLVFYIKNYPEGRFSSYLFNEAKINDLLRVEGPLGTFFLRNTQQQNIVLLATGTGIAPLIAILQDMDEDAPSFGKKNIFLFYGGRFVEDLFWKPQFNNIEVHFYPILSRNTQEWNGERGYIQDVVITKGIDLADAVVYACGSENMILDAKKVLTANGLVEDCFHSDAFVSTN